MKFVLNRLQAGDRLKGQVEEILPGGDVIICFSGDLIRVHNETRRPLKVGESVVVTVAAVNPLRFQIQMGKSRGHLDVSV